MKDERQNERLSSEAVIHSLRDGTRTAHECVNISRLGCMIVCGGLDARTGDDVEIEFIEGVSMPARVIWRRRGHLGLAFKEEINLATMRYLALLDYGKFEDMELRDNFGRLLPDILKRA